MKFILRAIQKAFQRAVGGKSPKSKPTNQPQKPSKPNQPSDSKKKNETEKESFFFRRYELNRRANNSNNPLRERDRSLLNELNQQDNGGPTHER